MYSLIPVHLTKLVFLTKSRYFIFFATEKSHHLLYFRTYYLNSDEVVTRPCSLSESLKEYWIDGLEEEMGGRDLCDTDCLDLVFARQPLRSLIYVIKYHD